MFRATVKYIFILIISVQTALAQTDTSTYQWINSRQTWGDQHDGTYVNPVIPADYSDIDVIRVDSFYYAISSTFQFSPGVVILRSADLVNWKIIGHVTNDITTVSPQLNWDKMNRYGKGVWAGAIRYHAGKFWVYFGTPDEGFFMSTANNPAGTWEPLQHFWDVQGWDDCCPFWDDDGQGYFIATHFSDHYKIHLFKMSNDGRQILVGSDVVIHQSEGSEANKLYKFNGMYYHYFSEVKPEGRVAMMERSKNIYGPYEIKQLNHVNPIEDKEPNQGGFVQTTPENWWFFTHQGTGSWEGRAACLLPVTWVNGWPIIGRVGADGIGNMVWHYKKPMPASTAITAEANDEFNKAYLLPQWEWNYQPRKDKWSLAEHKGFLRLYAFKPAKLIYAADERKPFYRAGNTITQRSMKTLNNEVVIKIDIASMADGEVAGLCHFSATYSSIGIKQSGGKRLLVYDNNGQAQKGPAINQTVIWLKSIWDWDGISKYYYSLDGKNFTTFGVAYQLTWGFYRGDRTGIFNYNTDHENGSIEVDWFHYSYASASGKLLK